MKTLKPLLLTSLWFLWLSSAAAGQLRVSSPASAPAPPPLPPTPPSSAEFRWGAAVEGALAPEVAKFPATIAWQEENGVFFANSQGGQTGKLSALKTLWEDAESDADKDRVREMLNDLLTEEFDLGLEQQQAELKAIEDRLERLRSRLKKRVDSKQEIVGLQSRQVIMSWDGLGWRGAGGEGPKGRASRNIFFRQGGNEDALKTLLFEAVEAKKTNEARLLLKSYLQRISQNPPDAVNNEVWNIYEQSRSKIEDADYWNDLAAALEALQQTDNPNLLDTLAHLKHETGNLKEALEYQRRAVKLLPGSKPTKLLLRVGPDHKESMEDYLKTLEDELQSRER